MTWRIVYEDGTVIIVTASSLYLALCEAKREDEIVAILRV